MEVSTIAVVMLKKKLI